MSRQLTARPWMSLPTHSARPHLVACHTLNLGKAGPQALPPRPQHLASALKHSEVLATLQQQAETALPAEHNSSLSLPAVS